MVTTTNKRILLIRNAASYDFGGGERFPVHLATQLQDNGYSPMVVSRSPQLLSYAEHQHVPFQRGWWWSQQNWSGKRVALFPLYVGWQFLLFGWYLQLIARLRPQVVHLQSKDDFVAGTFAARLLGKRVIWTDHADLKYVFANHTVWCKNPVGKLVYAASKLAHRITLVSQSERELITTALGHPVGAQYLVIYNGVNDERITPVDRPKTGTIICATSRLVTAKGIGELITAFQAIHTGDSDTTLWLVGDGPERQKFVDQAAGDDSIVFVGHSNEPLRYVAACDIFVHPSYHEGFSLSLIEAAMLAKPIVACNVGGNPEIINSGQNGLLVAPKSAAELEAALRTLLADASLRQQYATQVRQAFTERFNFTKIVKEQFIPLYEKA